MTIPSVSSVEELIVAGELELQSLATAIPFEELYAGTEL
jgi:hypothetical protein